MAAPALSGDDIFAVNATVVHSEWGPGIIMQNDDDVLTVLFVNEGYKTLSRKVVQERGLLTLAGDQATPAPVSTPPGSP